MDSASPGGWTNVCPRVHSHKQPFPLVVKPSNPPKSDQSHFGQFLSNRRMPDEQIMQGISDGGKSGSFYQKLSYNITRNINTSMDQTRCLLIVSRKTWSCININLVVDKVCRIQADFFFLLGFWQQRVKTPLHFSNFSSSHSPTGLQMLNLALIPKQQEFKCPSSLTQKNYLPGPDHISFFSNTHRERQRGKPVFQNAFIPYTPTAFLQT